MGQASSSFRTEDRALLERLEDEALLVSMFRHHVGAGAHGAPPRSTPHPRAAGLVSEVRKLPGGDAAVRAARAGRIEELVRFVEAAPLSDRPPVFLHHLAIYFGRVATELESLVPEAAAAAWTRSLAAWLSLAEERDYLARLEEAILGDDKRAERGVFIAPERVPSEVVAEIARRAEATARDLAPRGKAALLALSSIDEAARIAAVGPEAHRRARAEAERRRNAAIDAGVEAIGQALDDANVRGELASAGRAILLRALDVWTWASSDEAVEHFVVDRLGVVGWELYRARRWDALRYLLDPFLPMIESLASRIERDPTKIAYAASCAQMFVFLAEVETSPGRKLELAERAVRVCPTHRNGRLVLAALLCDRAMDSMRAMVLFARRDEIERLDALLERAERLYPGTRELPDAKAMLERIKRGKIAL